MQVETMFNIFSIHRAMSKNIETPGRMTPAKTLILLDESRRLVYLRLIIPIRRNLNLGQHLTEIAETPGRSRREWRGKYWNGKLVE